MYPDTTMRRGVRFPSDGTNTDSPGSERTRSTSERPSPEVKRLKGGRVNLGEEEYVPLASYNKALAHKDRMLEEQKAKSKRLEQRQRDSYHRDSFGRDNSYGGPDYRRGDGGDRRPPQK